MLRGMTAAEPIQLLGAAEVVRVKRWLESTTWIDLPFNAYEDEPRCMLSLCNGQRKLFDLRGRFRGAGASRHGVTVECKNYSTPGGQAKEFERFLAIAYSYTYKATEELGSDPQEEFFWVTKHPFAKTQWKDLCSKEKLKECVLDTGNSDICPTGTFNEDLAGKVANRVWILVVNEKQHHLSLSSSELHTVLASINREQGGLWEIS